MDFPKSYVNRKKRHESQVKSEKMAVFFDVMGTVNQVLGEDVGEILKTI